MTFLIYKLNDDKYLIVVNAANTEKDLEWMESHREGTVAVNDVSEQYARWRCRVPEHRISCRSLLIFP